MRFEESLTVWLPTQRWFAGKGRAIEDLAIETDTELAGGDPALRHLVVAVTQGETIHRYQVLAGLRAVLPDRLRHALIGRAEPAGDGRPCSVYDAAHDSDLTRVLLTSISSGDDSGPLRFRRSPGAKFHTDLESLVLTGEQSNTSLVYGEEAILKLFRRLTPGFNPDLEVTSALARLGSPHVARPFGWIEMDLDGTDTTLAILSEYLRTASDGWSLAETSVRDLYAGDSSRPDQAGGDFAGESHRLGAATAEVHRDLADAFGIGELDPDAVADLADEMRRRLDQARADVPEIRQYADAIRAVFDDLAKLGEPLTVQRIHGDYHLGQVVRTDTGWIVLDFEGEPAKPLQQRRAPSSTLRDIAGMLRSFDYAARAHLIGYPDRRALTARADAWTKRNRAAFCEGYAEASGADLHASEAVLRAFELDKAVYEVVYEARHRPSWLEIPLASLEAAA
jgi:maltokinase